MEGGEPSSFKKKFRMYQKGSKKEYCSAYNYILTGQAWDQYFTETKKQKLDIILQTHSTFEKEKKEAKGEICFNEMFIIFYWQKRKEKKRKKQGL